MAHSPKCNRRSDGCGGGGLSDLFSAMDQYQDDKIAQPFKLNSLYREDLNIVTPSSPSYLFPGSRVFLNGKTSSSEPISWVMKLELPSPQYSTQVGSCGAPSSPLPSLESVGTTIQFPSTLVGNLLTLALFSSFCIEVRGMASSSGCFRVGEGVPV